MQWRKGPWFNFVFKSRQKFQSFNKTFLMHPFLLCQNKVEVECLRKKKNENLLNNNLVADSYLQNEQLEVDRILESA